MNWLVSQIFRIILTYIIKIHETLIDDLPKQMYINRIKNRITFKIKTGCYFELFTPETMELLQNTEKKVTKYKTGENVPHLKVTEVALVHCNIVNNNYQQDPKFLYTFLPNKSFGQLLEISPKFFISLLIVWFTNSNSKPLEIKQM